MSDAITGGPGWVLAHNGTTVAEVRDFSGVEQTADTDDVTNQSSPDFYREKITTLLDGGDFTFDCNYVPGDGSQLALLTALKARGLESFTLTAPGGTGSFAFDARVTKFSGPKGSIGKAATLDITLAITGPVVGA